MDPRLNVDIWGRGSFGYRFGAVRFFAELFSVLIAVPLVILRTCIEFLCNLVI